MLVRGEATKVAAEGALLPPSSPLLAGGDAREEAAVAQRDDAHAVLREGLALHREVERVVQLAIHVFLTGGEGGYGGA